MHGFEIKLQDQKYLDTSNTMLETMSLEQHLTNK